MSARVGVAGKQQLSGTYAEDALHPIEADHKIVCATNI